MASSRPTRKSSRKSSPFSHNIKEAPTAPAEQPKEEKKTFMDRWVEPPLRQPAPSFEDYKGLERHGVLEHMAPLGVLPTTRVKLRVKPEPPKRVNQVKQSGNAMAREAPVTPEPPPIMGNRRSEPHKIEDRPPRTPSGRDVVEDADYTPKASTRSAVKNTPAQNSLGATPNSRTPAGRAILEQVVNAAVKRASEIGKGALGLAIKKIFDESLNNPGLAELLDAVLAQRPTKRQTADFQAYIQEARKDVKIATSRSNSARRSPGGAAGLSSKASSKSPSKSTRSGAASGTRNNVSTKIEAAEPNTSPSSLKLPHQEAATNGKTLKSNGMATNGKAKLRRSKSSSSSSSLSSLSSLDQTFAPSMETEHANTSDIPAQDRPMNASKAQSSLGPKLHIFSTTNSASNNNLKRSSTVAGLPHESADELLAAKRRKFEKIFDDYTVRDSSIRSSPVRKEPEPPQSFASKSSTSLPTPGYPKRLRNGNGKKIAKDDYEDLDSPSSSLPGDVLASIPALTGSLSRPGTPGVLGRPSKKLKKAARIKMSPMKKKSGVIAGIARASGGRESSVGYGAMDDHETPENSDFCSACGGEGYLLCCDGCDRSFHFTCLDPPMDANGGPDEPWYCYICEARKTSQPKPSRGLFAVLLSNLLKKNPVAYNLPLDIREYFEGVKTGEEGEYEEAVLQKPRARGGYDELPDLLKLKDSKGRYVLCFRCGKSALEHKEIIPCDFCNLQWHLDCLDPPMANPPPKGLNGKPKHSWMCPNHVEHELQNLDPSQRPLSTSHGANGIGKFHKIRRPKNARIVDTALRRGFTNNGLIEIENEESEDEQFVDRESYGVVYRLPEKGIKLDFIDRAKRSRDETRQSTTPTFVQAPPVIVRGVERKSCKAVENRAALKSDFENRPFVERKTALNLAQLAHFNNDLNLSLDQMENLVGTLIAEAPPDVVDMIMEGSTIKNSASPPSPAESEQAEQKKSMSKKDRATLLLFQDLIRRKLESDTMAT
ncbi:MAG: hypothetical protein M1827_006783 [Pycnora praestabilis]|nr:MAG: hypothetical protein M1827_006783 [Pycnora praestabilis]